MSSNAIVGALTGSELATIYPRNQKIYWVNKGQEKDRFTKAIEGNWQVRSCPTEIITQPLSDYPTCTFFLNYWHAYAFMLSKRKAPNE